MENLRDVAEMYIAKRDPQIVLISTPNRPGDIMEQISLEKNSLVGLYHRIYTDYFVCLRDGMFTKEEIQLQQKSPSFQRNYNLQFLGEIGNVFNPLDIDSVTQEKYSLDHSYTTSEVFTKWVAADGGYGSSEFGITIVQWTGKLEVVYSDSFERILYQDAFQ